MRPQRDFADIIVAFHRPPDAADDELVSARLTVRPTLPFSRLREAVGSISGSDEAPIRWTSRTDARGPMSELEIDGSCPPVLGSQLEEALWGSLRPDDRPQRERLGVVRHVGSGERRSEVLALSQLLIVAHLVGVLDGAFDL